MSAAAQDELLASFRRLYEGGQYTDLTIRSRVASFAVHRAIICPRSSFFTSACHGTPPVPVPDGGGGEESVLDLADDDPLAVKMVIDYMYHLDYPCSASPPEQDARANGYHDDAGGGDEDACDSPAALPVAASQKQAPSVASQEDRDIQHSSTLVKQVKPGRKGKKKRKSSLAASLVNGSDLPGDNTQFPEIQDASAEPATGTPAEVADDQGGDGHDGSGPQSFSTQADNSNLVTHAKVFSLSQKYGIGGLRGLALDKFQKEAAEGWDTPSFLAAVKEVYHSSMDDCEDRRMREAVTDIVCQHPDLLDKPATQDAIKDLQLNYDLLMRMRRNSII